MQIHPRNPVVCVDVRCMIMINCTTESRVASSDPFGDSHRHGNPILALRFKPQAQTIPPEVELTMSNMFHANSTRNNTVRDSQLKSGKTGFSHCTKHGSSEMTQWFVENFGRKRSCAIEEEPFLQGENPFLPRCELVRQVYC